MTYTAVAFYHKICHPARILGIETFKTRFDCYTYIYELALKWYADGKAGAKRNQERREKDKLCTSTDFVCAFNLTSPVAITRGDFTDEKELMIMANDGEEWFFGAIRDNGEKT